MGRCCKMRRGSGCGDLPLFNKSELAVMFGVHRNTIITRLQGVQPDDVQSGHGVYALPNVAVRLCALPDVEHDLLTLLRQRARAERRA